MQTITTPEKELIELPDFFSYTATAEFITTLKGHTERYGVKALLYRAEMILSHLRRIDKHSTCAHRILIRVNGDITPTQRKAYDLRTAEAAARKFYTSMSYNSLINACHDAHIVFPYTYAGVNRPAKEMMIDMLVKVHVQREVGENNANG